MTEQLDKQRAYLEFFAPNYNFSALGGPGDFLAAFVDDGGRPIRENKATPEVRANSSYDFKTCPYSGSRLNHPLPMNASAMRQLGKHWETILDATALTRARYLQSVGKSVVDTLDILRIANIGSVAPVFLLFRQENPYANGSLPAAIAGLFKVLIDLRSVATRMLIDSGAPRVVTQEELFTFAEDGAHLLGPPLGVCAGPPKMIRELIDVVINGSGREPRDVLTPLAGDIQPLMDYSNEMMVLQFAHVGAWTRLQHIVRTFADALPAESRSDALVTALQKRPRWTLPYSVDDPVARANTLFGVSGLVAYMGGDHGAQVSADLSLTADVSPRDAREAYCEYVEAEVGAARAFTSIQTRLLEARGFPTPPALDTNDVRVVFGDSAAEWLGGMSQG